MSIAKTARPLLMCSHRLMAEALVNFLGNCLATIVVAQWEHAIDGATLQGLTGRRRSRPARIGLPESPDVR
jgi:Na+/H+-dicarboxylate symporter